ncbi:MAG: hypothetical protein NZ700_15465 [Gemmataceae bacterium]|nr:hypothetical protein [Gemmataceae bacterium]MDW8266092.1 hypothetical protein [Gemmataceae bacterium]
MPFYQRLVRDVLYPLDCWRAGETARLRYLREFERTQYAPPTQLRELQWRRLQALLRHAYQNCPFYRDRFRQAGVAPDDFRGPEDLVLLPLLEKRDLQEQRDRLVAENWPTADLVPNASGGSTGTPVSFFVTKDRLLSRSAATWRHNRWAGWDIGHKVGIVWSAPQDQGLRTWRRRLRNWLLDRTLELNTALLTPERIRAFHGELLRFRPDVLLGYARSIALVARFIRENRLRPCRPRAIVTSAEMLEPHDRAVLEEVFGCPVFNRYGCREVSVIASECPQHQGLHIMAEGLFLEILKDGRPAALGELGEVVVTDLLNFGMPLIRYRIGDMASWQEGSCPCGRTLPRLREVAGRLTDFLVGSDGRLVSGVYLATYLVGQRPEVGQVQFVQTVAGRVSLLIKPGRRFRVPDDPDFLTSALRQHLGPDTEIDWQLVDDLRPEPSGKYLFCRSTAWKSAGFGRPGPAKAESLSGSEIP